MTTDGPKPVKSSLSRVRISEKNYVRSLQIAFCLEEQISYSPWLYSGELGLKTS
jgi:hypothetical protein